MTKAELHRARQAALQILYQWEVGRIDVARAADTLFELQWADAAPPAADVREFATALAHETVGRLERVDALIAGASEHWRPERMATVDRLVMRMAAAELLRGAAPAPVVINEALELARRFSTEESVKFINGVLDAIHRAIGPPGQG